MHSAHNLGFICDEHLIFSKSCYSHIRELLYLRPTLSLKLLVSLLLLSFIPNLITATYCIYNLPKRQIYRLQNTQNSLVRAVAMPMNPLTSLLFSKLMNA